MSTPGRVRDLTRPGFHRLAQPHLDALYLGLRRKRGHAGPRWVLTHLPRILNLGGRDPLVACRILADHDPSLHWQRAPVLVAAPARPTH